MRGLAQQLLETKGEGTPAQPLGRSVVYACRREGGGPVLLVVSECRKQLPGGFEGEELRLDDGALALVCPFLTFNAVALRRHFPWCAPSIPGGERPTVALGSPEEAAERLPLLRGRGLVPVFPASPSGGLSAADAAVFAVFSAGFRDGFAVDGGRVSSVAGVEKALAEGAGVVTLTPGGGNAAGEVAEYAGRRFILNARDAVFFSRETAELCAARFGGVVEAAAAVKAKRTAPFDLGIVLDAADVPAEAAHLYLVRELRRRGIDCSVVFPDGADSAEAFRVHAAIAAMYGAYRLALPLAGISPERFRELRRECGGAFHLEPDMAAWKQFAAYFPA